MQYGNLCSQIETFIGEVHSRRCMKPSRKQWVSIILMLILPFSGCVTQPPSPTAAVKGRVAAEDGIGIPGVKVTHDYGEAFSDDEGYFSLECSPGVCSLSFSKEGHAKMTIVITVADTGTDTGVIVMLQSEHVLHIEELTAYVSTENLIDSYIMKGFENLGTIRVEYTEGALYITTLVTSTQSGFVLEHQEAAGVVFDFSAYTKEIHMGEIGLTAPFGTDEWHAFIEESWSSQEDEEEIQYNFAETLKEDPEIQAFVEMIAAIEEDSVRPDFLQKARLSEAAQTDHGFFRIEGFGTVQGLFALPVNLLRWDSPYRKEAHGAEKKELEARNTSVIENGQLFEHENLEFVSTVVYGLRWVINPPKAVRPPQIDWVRKVLAMKIKVFLEILQESTENLKKEFENSKKEMEDSRKNLEDSGKALENSRKEVENSKKALEDSKKSLEDLKKKYEEMGSVRGSYGGDIYKNKIKELEKEIQKLEKTIKELEDTIKDLDNGIKRNEKATEELNEKISKFEEDIKDIEQRLQEIKAWKKILDDIIKDC